MEKGNSYESLFIVSLANGEEAAKATVSKFTNLIAANAEVIRVDEWGKRRLAYPIQDMNDGYYTIVTFKNDGNFPAELQRLMNIDETILRAITIKLEYDAAKRVVETPVAQEPSAPVEDEENEIVEEAEAEEVPAEEAPEAEPEE